MSRKSVVAEIAAEFGESSLIKNRHLVNWFEIPYLNHKRASNFYESVFDIKLKISNSPEGRRYQFPINLLSGGASGTLSKGIPSTEGATIYFTTNNLPLTLKKALAKGGKIIKPITAISSNHGYYAHILDSEGNKIGLHAYSL